MRGRTAIVVVVALGLAGIAWWSIKNGPEFRYGYESPGQAQNSATSVTGVSMVTSYKPVHYLFFNGNDGYGLIPANEKLNVRQFSIAFWTKSDGPPHSSFDRPIEMLRWISTSGIKIPYGWAFDAGDQSQIGIDKLRFTVGNTLGYLYITNTDTVPRNTWTHIVGTFDGKTLKLYQNVALVSEFPFSGSYSYPNPPLPI